MGHTRVTQKFCSDLVAFCRAVKLLIATITFQEEAGKEPREEAEVVVYAMGLGMSTILEAEFMKVNVLYIL